MADQRHSVAGVDPATYNLRDEAGYLVFATHDLEAALAEHDRRKDGGEVPRFDDFGVTELRERLADLKRHGREVEKAWEANGEA